MIKTPAVPLYWPELLATVLSKAPVASFRRIQLAPDESEQQE
jgi:hypothetical protein